MEKTVRVFKVKTGYYIKDFNHENMDNIMFSLTGFVGHAYNFNNYIHNDDDYDIYKTLVGNLEEQTGGSLMEFTKEVTYKQVWLYEKIWWEVVFKCLIWI